LEFQATASTRARALFSPRYALYLAALTVAVYAVSRLGFAIDGVMRASPAASTVWPAAGLGLAALLIAGGRVWPALTAGLLVGALSAGVHPGVAVSMSAGGTLAALLGAGSVWRFGGTRDTAIHSVRGACVLVAFAAFGSTTLSAGFGALGMSLTWGIPAHQVLRLWAQWWASDIVGVLLLAPLLLAIPSLGHEGPREVGRFEAVAALLAVCGVSVLVFASDPHSDLSIHTYFVFPPLLWAALRVRQPGAALASFLVAVIAISLR
jgi:integral membrane sensor domain MASE1